MWNSPLDSSPVVLRCPVMLVVGDQAPYEDAAVSSRSRTLTLFLLFLSAFTLNCSIKLFFLYVTTRWSATAKWTQQRPHFLRYFFWFLSLFALFASVVVKRLSSLSSVDG